jgi:hypothetical protein
MSESKQTRTGFRYGVIKSQELVDQAQGEFTRECPEEGCWLIIQGGNQAVAEHRRVIHGAQPNL